MASKKEIHQVLARLAAAYPHFQLTEETISVYCEMLEDIPFPELLEAAHKHIKVSTFFPTVAELRASFEERQARLRSALQERCWRENLERYKSEALSAGEAKKMLQVLNDAADKPNASSIVLFRKGIKEILTERPTRYEVGAGMTDEEWEERKKTLAKSVDEEPRPPGKEVDSPIRGGRGA